MAASGALPPYDATVNPAKSGVAIGLPIVLTATDGYQGSVAGSITCTATHESGAATALASDGQGTFTGDFWVGTTTFVCTYGHLPARLAERPPSEQDHQL